MTTDMSKFKKSGKFKEIDTSILAPQNGGLRFVLSFINTKGKTEGKWFSLFDKKWKKLKEETKGFYTLRTGEYKLGKINQTAVQSDTWVIHLLCQDDNLKTDLKALEVTLKKVKDLAIYEHATVHVTSILIDECPELKDMLKTHLVDEGVSVNLYKE
jgi:hypothetical protein